MSQKKIKRLENPWKFLLDSGLLFEINRVILHPMGLAVEVVIAEDGGVSLGGIWDYRGDPEGMVFETQTFEDAAKKLNKFMEDYGDKALRERVESFGFFFQGRDPMVNMTRGDPLESTSGEVFEPPAELRGSHKVT